ncbi:uncharacterized protein LOC131432465 [Malaya genurostris]|uniref:uncharacterized protein LOC131432465 n=1 Tax=Malaya genurostris TaxID=325434 RepID=UPI0026F38A65|nr:uncharacterized protein LOC131432465 [Malaya genurostris]
MNGLWKITFCLGLLLMMASAEEMIDDIDVDLIYQTATGNVIEPKEPTNIADAPKPPVILETSEPVIPVAVCTPTQESLQKIVGQLSTIIQELWKLQKEEQLKMVESGRQQQANTVGVLQLWRLAQQLQNIPPPMGATGNFA